MTFDPDTIKLPQEFHERMDRSHWSPRQKEVLAARQGATQAVEALRYQWPKPVTDRPPTEEDGDDLGQVLFPGTHNWTTCSWQVIADLRSAWLHTPNWRPKPEPTEKEQALKLVGKVGHELEDPEYALLYRVVQSAPDTTPCPSH